MDAHDRQTEASPPLPEDVKADLFDFVDDFARDEAEGRVLPLGDYLARYPRAQAEVAAEYLRLTGKIDGGAEARPSAGEAEAEEDDVPRIGRYRLLRQLGAGGQGEVWLGRDDGLRRDVAVKLLGARFVTEDQRARFRREAESIARLEHPGVAQVYEADVDGDPPYIAMRFVEGVDLGAAVAAELAAEEGSTRVGGPVPVRPVQRGDVHRVLRFFEKAARALHAAHEAGVVHRDVKPGNIMVTGVGDPVLLDFGLARDERGSADGRNEPVLTREGDVFGTLAYMAPEQLRGETERVDARADIWALGVTLFEVLTGQRPFDGNGPAALAIAINQGQRRSLRALNRAVPPDAVVVAETALEPSLERRYGTALALAEDLRRVREYEPILAIPAGPGLRLRRWCRREPAWAVAILGSVVALVLGLIASQIALEQNRRLVARYEGLYKVEKMPAIEPITASGSLALGLEAVGRHDVSVTRSVLVRPLLDLTLDARFQLGRGRAWQGLFLEKGGPAERIAIVGPAARVAVASVGERRVLVEREVGAQAYEGAKVPGGALLVGTEDGRVLSLDPASLETLAELDTGEEAVTDLVAPRADVAAALVGKTRVVMFGPEAGDVLREVDLAEHGTFGALHAAVLPSGDVRILATSYGFHGPHTQSASPSAVLLDPGADVDPVLLAHGAPVVDASIAAGRALAVTVDAAGVVRGIDLARGEWSRGADGVLADIDLRGAAVAIDGAATRLVVGADVGAGSEDHAVRGFALDGDGEARLIWTAPGGPRIADLAFRPGRPEVACASWLADPPPRVLHADSGEVVRVHREVALPKELTWSRGGERLLGVGNISFVDVWSGAPDPGAHRLAWRRDGRVVEPSGGAFVPGTERVALWNDEGAGVLLEAPRGPSGAEPACEVLSFGPEEGGADAGGVVLVADAAPVLVSLGSDLSIARIDAAAGAVAQRVPGRGSEVGAPLWSAVSDDGGAVWTLTTRGRLLRWSADVGWSELDLGADPGVSAALRPRHDAAVVARESGALLRVDHAGGRLEISDLAPAGGPLAELCVSGDGARIAAVLTGEMRFPVMLWDAESGAELGQVMAAPGVRLRLAWSGTDGLVAAAPGKIAAAWHISLAEPLPASTDVEGWKARLISPTFRHGDELLAFGSDPGAHLICTASKDGTVQVWDDRSGEVLLRPAPFRTLGGGRTVSGVDDVIGASLDRDASGSWVLAVGRRGAAVWPLEVAKLASERAPRRLSSQERSPLELDEL
ncbi:MAG: serine/threonine-protein kinase [Planctomycetota bacterium]|nr:serine/threonine-protein kinase [Planctomycetota bacterium]